MLRWEIKLFFRGRRLPLSLFASLSTTHFLISSKRRRGPKNFFLSATLQYMLVYKRCTYYSCSFFLPCSFGGFLPPLACCLVHFVSPGNCGDDGGGGDLYRLFTGAAPFEESRRGAFFLSIDLSRWKRNSPKVLMTS